MLPVPLGGLAAQEGAAIFVFFGAQILKKIQNGHNTNHGFVADFTQSPFFFSFSLVDRPAVPGSGFFLEKSRMKEEFTPES